MHKSQYHRLALVRSDHIGRFTQVDAFSRIYDSAEIGHHCSIGNYCLIQNNVQIGNHVIIKDGVLVSEGVTIKDRVFVGPHVTFDVSTGGHAADAKRTLICEGARIGANATVLRGATVGRYARIDAGSVVAQDVPDFAHVSPGPTCQAGWVCTCGKALDLPAKGQGQAICSCDRRYALVQGQVTGVTPLPV